MRRSILLSQFWGFYTPSLNALPGFFIKGNIINHDFMHIDQALKPRPCVPFLLSLLLTKVNYLP